ncbi:MAG: class I SAM-dependent methyltransferase [Bermanella sp.]
MDKEFHDLAELQLNIEPTTGEINSSWGNLGYWASSRQRADQSITSTSYPQACGQLARELANIATLDASHKVLDTGFGCGDQLLLWLEEYQVQHLSGINLSFSQTQHAQEKIKKLKLGPYITCSLNVGDCSHERSWQKLDETFNRIIALDCIYHFNDKQNYFSLCKQHLEKNGALVITDLVLTTKNMSFWQKIILKSICYFSHIPYKNLQTQEHYQKHLSNMGLVITQQRYISQDVFLPFGQWLKGYIQQIEYSQKVRHKYSWLKYRGTAKFLAWGYKNKIFNYCILRIEAKSSKFD